MGVHHCKHRKWRLMLSPPTNRVAATLDKILLAFSSAILYLIGAHTGSVFISKAHLGWCEGRVLETGLIHDQRVFTPPTPHPHGVDDCFSHEWCINMTVLKHSSQIFPQHLQVEMVFPASERCCRLCCLLKTEATITGSLSHGGGGGCLRCWRNQRNGSHLSET